MDNSYANMDWAKIIDIFAHEYGWTIDEIKKLNLGQIVILLKTIRARYKKSEDGIKDSDLIENPPDKELSIDDFKAMGGKERVRSDGRTEIVL